MIVFDLRYICSRPEYTVPVGGMVNADSLSKEAQQTLRKMAGKRPDREVADKVGLRIEDVRAYRKQNNVKAFVPNPVPSGQRREVVRTAPVDLLPYLDRLGRVPDEDVANEAGVTRGRVRSFRMSRGIPPYEAYKHNPDSLPPLRTEAPSLRAVAPVPVPVPAPAPAPVAAAPVAAPARAPEVRRGPGRPPKNAASSAPAARVGRSSRAPAQRRRGPPSRMGPYEHLVGKIPDSQIAAQAGLKPNTVSKWRIARGIAPAPRRVGAPVAREAKAEALPPEPGEIRPVPAPKEAAKAPVAAASPAVAPKAAARTQKAGHQAYRVVASWAERRAEYVVIGSDLPGAAARAQELLAGLGPWNLEQVVFLGEALG